jgi:hypothetical protein
MAYSLLMRNNIKVQIMTLAQSKKLCNHNYGQRIQIRHPPHQIYWYIYRRCFNYVNI